MTVGVTTKLAISAASQSGMAPADASLTDMMGAGNQAAALALLGLSGAGAPASIGVATLTINGGIVIADYDYETPANAGTVTIPAGAPREVINQGSSLATLTVNLPTGPVDGQECAILATHAVGTVTFAAGGTLSVSGAPAALTANQWLWGLYRAANTTWFFGS